MTVTVVKPHPLPYRLGEVPSLNTLVTECPAPSPPIGKVMFPLSK